MDFKVYIKDKKYYQEISSPDAAYKNGYIYFTSEGLGASQDAIICQYTGINDSYDNKIYEGDIILRESSMYLVFFNKKLLQYGYGENRTFYTFNDKDDVPISVVGNIYKDGQKNIYVVRNVSNKRKRVDTIFSLQSNYQIKI